MLSVFCHNSFATERVNLQLKYLHQFQFAGYYAALEQGFYKEVGLDVNIIQGESGEESQAAVLSGQAQFGVGSSSLVLEHATGNPLVVLAVIFQHSPYTLVVPFRDDTQGVHHIAGKRVMIAPQADELIAYLKKESIDINKLERVPHSFNPDDLINGNVEAFSAYLTNETNYFDQQNYKYLALSPRSAGIDFYGDNLFTSQQEIESNPQRVKDFVSASIRGWQYAFANQNEIINLIYDKYTQRSSKDHLAYEAKRMEMLVQPSLVELGYMNPGRWQHIVDTYIDLGMLSKSYQLDGFLYKEAPVTNLALWYSLTTALVLIIIISTLLHFRSRSAERMRAKEQIEFKNLLLTTQQEASQEGLLAIDNDERIISANASYRRLWGIDQAIIDGGDNEKLVAIILTKVADVGAFLSIVANAKRRRHQTLLKELTLKDGRILEYYCAPMIAKNNQYYGRLWSFRDITTRKQAEQQIWNKANLDFLTGLPNRYMHYDRLQQHIKIAKRSNRKVALLFLDLDRFKEVNDTLGHHVGDRLIQQTGQRLQQSVRETDTIARLGGDEFTVVIGELITLDIVDKIANNILHQLALPFYIEDEVAYISSSIGITLFPDDGDDAETLLKNADQAMYAAKDKGRNGIQYFTQAMQYQALMRLNITNDLRQAIVDQQFELYYQPIIDLHTGLIAKAEALIRWHHPERGLVSPLEFIEIAEETGMIIDIGSWVFNQACWQLSQWREISPEIQMSINVSPLQFSSSSAMDQWGEQLSAFDLPGSALIVEITEGLLMDATEETSVILNAFSDAGIQVALDDFGTGYSSLSYLNRFDIDYLKIDQSFIRNIETQSSDLAVCEAMIVMAHKLGLKVIAEGVETLEQKAIISSAECDFAQGYVVAKPLSSIDFYAAISNQGEPLENN
jgi:diguanylate cyclase (GGDEF)-like protein